MAPKHANSVLPELRKCDTAFYFVPIPVSQPWLHSYAVTEVVRKHPTILGSGCRGPSNLRNYVLGERFVCSSQGEQKREKTENTRRGQLVISTFGFMQIQLISAKLFRKIRTIYIEALFSQSQASQQTPWVPLQTSSIFHSYKTPHPSANPHPAKNHSG